MQPIEDDCTTASVTALPTLAQAYFDELKVNLRGEVYRRGDHQYVDNAHVVVRPTKLSHPHSPFQLLRAHAPVQRKCFEHFKGRRTSPRRTGCLAVSPNPRPILSPSPPLTYAWQSDHLL